MARRVGRSKRVLAGTLLALACVGDAAAARFALLMGVGDYSPPISDLAGAENDATALRDVLVARWGFDAKNVRTLKSLDADRLGVLNAFTGILSDSAPGDHVFVFFAGHGTSASDRALGYALPHTSGALLPSDVKMGAADFFDRLLVGRRDLRPLLEALDRGERKVLVVFDSCFSGNTVRGAFADELGRPRLPGRGVDLPQRATGAAPAAPAPASTEPYPYRNVVYFAAAAEHETAGDIPADYLQYYPTRDSKPHGAFTDALLRGLHGQLPGMDGDGDGVVAHGEMFEAVGRFMGGRRYPQTPQLLPALSASTLALLDAPLFGATPAGLLAAPQAPAPKPKGVAVRFVGFDAAAAKQLAAGAGVDVATKDAPYALVAKDGKVVLVDGAGDAVAEPVPSDGAPNLLKQVALRDSLDRFVAALPSKGVRVGFSGDGLGATRVDGDKVAFRVLVDSPAHVAVVDLDAEGTLRLLYPYDDAEIRVLPAARELELGGSTVVAPYGLDRVVVLAFDQFPPALRPYLRRDLAAGSADARAFLDALRAAKPRAGAATSILAVRRSP